MQARGIETEMISSVGGRLTHGKAMGFQSRKLQVPRTTPASTRESLVVSHFETRVLHTYACQIHARFVFSFAQMSRPAMLLTRHTLP